MNICKLLWFGAVFVCATAPAVAAADDSGLAASIYNHAHARNREALMRLKRNGYSLDAVDSRGNTALCRAIVRKDEGAYNLLRQMGADISHPCVKRMEAAVRPVKNDKFVWNIGPTTYLGAAALVGGTIAIAAGGSGGGSKSDGAGGDGSNPGDEGGDKPGGDVVEEVDAEFFKTEEYTAGNFLPQIGAAEAYARFYGVKSNEPVSSLEKVAVGVVDSGVYGSNAEFAGKDISGVNYDYGPCTKSSVNCWQWASEYTVVDSSTGQKNTFYNVSYLKMSDGRIYITRIGEEGTKAEYDEWAGEYPQDYDWNEIKDSPTNYYPNDRDEAMHGTHVAGIIAANREDYGMHGVAFENAEIIAARWDMMSPLDAPVKDVIDMGAQVVNFSLGIDSTEFMNASTIKFYTDVVDPYLESFRYQAENNTVFVFSAGNEMQKQPGILNGIPLLDEFKDSLKNLFVTVVALDENVQLASYSNACGAAQNYCIAAPGTNIVSSVWGGNNYGTMSGTSMAAPVVTGGIAFLMGAYPYMTPQEVVSLIFETADDLGDPGVDAVFGHGRLNLNAATEPQGELTIATSANVKGESVLARSTTMSVPAVFKSALTAKMPRSITAFDKYKRPYAMPAASFVKATHSGERNFKNDLYAFSRRQAKQRVASDGGIAFSYAPAALSDSPTGLGTMEVEYGSGSHVTGFYYTENTLYNNDAYFEKALSNPFLAMNSAYGVYNRYQPSSDWEITMGFATGENGLYDGSRDDNDRDFDNQAYGFDSEAAYKMTDDLTVTVMSGVLYEDSAMLGLNGSGGFDVGDSSTYYAGLSIGWSPMKNLFLSGAYYQGWTDAGRLASNLMQTSRLVSDSFALDGHYRYNKTDVIGMQISSPLRIYKGKASFDLPVGRDNYSDEVYRERFSAGLKPDAREYKFSLYHDREINEDMDFKAQFDMRLNPDHQKDAETDYRVMFGFNWTFN